MAGVYIHIPFCRQACNYCDFHFTTYLRYAGQAIDAMNHEIRSRKEYLEQEIVDTIYLGGGTPSVLSADHIENLLAAVRCTFPVSTGPEVTIEVNPEDVSDEKVRRYLQSGINRISMGVQSFRDSDLKFLNRRHTSGDALEAIGIFIKHGFRNISIDLMYGLPEVTGDQWKASLAQAFTLGINHLSAYHLSYEPGTVLHYKREKGNLRAIREEESEKQYRILLTTAQEAGFEQYEISNFAHGHAYSRHNTSYWTGKKYIGIGPSAHSFNGRERRWNNKGIMSYIRSIREGRPYYEQELLDTVTLYNEYVMTGLRTMWGIDLVRIQKEFGNEYHAATLERAQPFIMNSTMVMDCNKLMLTEEGRFVADYVIRELFIEQDTPDG